MKFLNDDRKEYIPMFALFIVFIIVSPEDTKKCSQTHMISAIITLVCIIVFYSLVCMGIHEITAICISSLCWILIIWMKRKMIAARIS